MKNFTFKLTFFFFILLTSSIASATPISSRVKQSLSTVEYQEQTVEIENKSSSNLKTVLLKIFVVLVILGFITFPAIVLGILLLAWVSAFLGTLTIIAGSLLSIWLIVLVLMNTEKRRKRKQVRKERRQTRRTQRTTALN